MIPPDGLYTCRSTFAFFFNFSFLVKKSRLYIIEKSSRKWAFRRMRNVKQFLFYFITTKNMVNIRENNLNCERMNPWTKETRFINLQHHVMMSKRFDVLSYLSFLAVAVEVLGSWYSLPHL